MKCGLRRPDTCGDRRYRDTMSRVQVALNVGDLQGAIAFYSNLFGVAPHKVRDDYANFVVSDPPLKLVLIANGGAPGTLNHIGVEVQSTDDVIAAAESAQERVFQRPCKKRRAVVTRSKTRCGCTDLIFHGRSTR